MQLRFCWGVSNDAVACLGPCWQVRVPHDDSKTSVAAGGTSPSWSWCGCSTTEPPVSAVTLPLCHTQPPALFWHLWAHAQCERRVPEFKRSWWIPEAWQPWTTIICLSFCKYFIKHFQGHCRKIIWLKGLGFVTQILQAFKCAKMLVNVVL